MKVQLVTFPGCPNADATRETLRRALVASGLDPAIEEIDSSSPQTPRPLCLWGSPTVLIEGVDVGGEETPAGPACRLYRDPSGRAHGSPSELLLLEAIRLALNARSRDAGVAKPS